MRRTALKRKGGDRFPKNRDDDYRAFVRAWPCAIGPDANCWGDVQACHVKTRGAGGMDRGNLWPGCLTHHAEQHAMDIVSFQRHYGIDLERVAHELERLYETRVAA